MSEFSSIRKYAKFFLPYGVQDGVFLMLSVYVDDSGTHSGSPVVVLGAIAGTIEQWAPFEEAWAARLADPLPGYGKPPLKMFHLGPCHHGLGKFIDYSQAEQDRVTYEFRKILIDAKLISFSCAVDKVAWDELTKGRWGSALGACADRCVREAIMMAANHEAGSNMVLTFDQGIWSAYLQSLLDPFVCRPGIPRVCNIGRSSVDLVRPLQGADIVATENYWYAAQVLNLGEDMQVRPHMRHYLDNMIHQGFILDRSAISEMVLKADEAEQST